MSSKDPSGHSLSEGRIQAQWALRVTWVAQLDLRLSGAYSASQRLTVTSREVVRLFLEQLRFDFVPVFHYLQGRFAA